MWKDEFVLVGIASNVLQCETDFCKQKGYAINLNSDNFKNELHQAVNATGLCDSGCLSGYFHMVADNAQE